MRFLCYGRTAKDNKIQFSVKNKKKCDALLYFSTICSIYLQEHFALFRHKKTNPTSIVVGFLISTLVIGICKSNSNKLQMLPTLTRHLQIQFQQVADASDPDQASVAPKTTNQRCPPVNFLLKFAGGIFIASLFHQIAIYVSF